MALLPFSLLSKKSSSGHENHHNYWDYLKAQRRISHRIFFLCTAQEIFRGNTMAAEAPETPRILSLKRRQTALAAARGLLLCRLLWKCVISGGKAFKPLPYLPPVLKCKAPPEKILSYKQVSIPQQQLRRCSIYLKEQNQMWSDESSKPICRETPPYVSKHLLASVHLKETQPCINQCFKWTWILFPHVSAGLVFSFFLP